MRVSKTWKWLTWKKKLPCFKIKKKKKEKKNDQPAWLELKKGWLNPLKMGIKKKKEEEKDFFCIVYFCFSVSCCFE
jgi:hypothetical protein